MARQFLERHPERRAELVALAQAGRFAVTGGGETIVDANLILGESLARNFVMGLLWVEETFGARTRLAVRNEPSATRRSSPRSCAAAGSGGSRG